MNFSAITSVANLTASEIQPKVEALTREERARASHLTGSALRHASPAEQRAAVSAQFEAILIRQMLGKTLTSMLGTGNNTSNSIYGEMLTDTFAQQLSAGSGFGMAALIEKQLTPRSPVADAPAPSNGAAASSPRTLTTAAPAATH